MKTIDGKKYTRKQFDGYELRVMIKIIDKKGDEHLITIYTEETDLIKIQAALEVSINKDKVVEFKVFHTATKEQDDRSTELINEWLKEPITPVESSVTIRYVEQGLPDKFIEKKKNSI